MAGLSSVLVFIAPLLSAYFRLDLLLTWLNENILTYFDIALDILVLLLVVSFHVVSLSEWDHAKKKSSATQLWRGAWLLGAVLYTVMELGGKLCQTMGQIAGDTCCTENSCRSHLEMNSGREILLKRMAPFNFILIKRVYSSLKQVFCPTVMTTISINP